MNAALWLKQARDDIARREKYSFGKELIRFYLLMIAFLCLAWCVPH